MDLSLTLELPEEYQQLRDLVREVVKNEVIPVRMELDEKAEFPTGVMAKFREAGLFNALYPEEYGGLGMGMIANIILSEEIAYGCLGVGTTFLASKVGALPIEIG